MITRHSPYHMEVKTNIMEIKKIGEDREKEKEMVLIKLGSEEQK